MIQRKGCPRCSGDLFLDDDIFSKELVCLQCGYRRPATQPAVPLPKAA